MGKGSKRRLEDYKQFCNHFDEIEWRKKGSFCFDCGRTFEEKDKRKFYKDGNAYCIECNFN